MFTQPLLLLFIEIIFTNIYIHKNNFIQSYNKTDIFDLIRLCLIVLKLN